MKKLIPVILSLLLVIFTSATALAAEKTESTFLSFPIKIAAGTDAHHGMNMEGENKATGDPQPDSDPDHHNMDHGTVNSGTDHSQMDSGADMNGMDHGASNPHAAGDPDKTADSGPNWLIIGAFGGVIAAILIIAAVLKRKQRGGDHLVNK
ncbi:hypothetical protein Sgly_0515 [Syntrophobotulus glycolicus DSM 8271]|uniref:Uncharacterized protein n=1 Tax=Syntrophobotulus glycolicus (strain DSM 8271 / FlGlyR) TaxID=645991 RepID=F0SYS9_SYNGF|nr:hypothetical protein [Syntrophobotulus glycolicus]ADY54880.1 hypothetical protein Sgly_0515 [Syntrophobotulus glycolicus DSM 8271]